MTEGNTPPLQTSSIGCLYTLDCWLYKTMDTMSYHLAVNLYCVSFLDGWFVCGPFGSVAPTGLRSG